DTGEAAPPDQVDAPAAPFPVRLPKTPPNGPRPAVSRAGRSRRVRMLGGRGAYVGSVVPRGEARDFAPDATLRAAAPHPPSRGAGAELLLPLTGSVDLAEARLRLLPTGGRTPLAHGLRLAAATLRRHVQGRAGSQPLLVLVTDGRANVPLAGGDPLADAREQA